MAFDKYKIYNGKSISDWSKETGIKAATIAYRLRKGLSIEDAVSMPVKAPAECSKKHDVLGKVFTDRFGNEYKVVEIAFRDKYSVAHYKCVFLKSGYETTAVISQIIGSKQHLFDRLSPSVHGVGIMGYAYAKDNPKLFDVWRSMIARCYNCKNPSYKTYGAKDVRVCERWKRFDFFLEDAPLINGYDQEKINNGQLVLDKDIINRNAKIYSLETCSFVTRRTNAQESANRRWKKREKV